MDASDSMEMFLFFFHFKHLFRRGRKLWALFAIQTIMFAVQQNRQMSLLKSKQQQKIEQKTLIHTI